MHLKMICCRMESVTHQYSFSTQWQCNLNPDVNWTTLTSQSLAPLAELTKSCQFYLALQYCIHYLSLVYLTCLVCVYYTLVIIMQHLVCFVLCFTHAGLRVNLCSLGLLMWYDITSLYPLDIPLWLHGPLTKKIHSFFLLLSTAQYRNTQSATKEVTLNVGKLDSNGHGS